jgi:hypothetical protein
LGTPGQGKQRRAHFPEPTLILKQDRAALFVRKRALASPRRSIRNYGHFLRNWKSRVFG